MAETKVFISHSSQNSDWLRSFAQALESQGFSVWFEEFAIAPGDSIAEAMESGLRDSDIIVTLVDAHDSSKPNFYFELGAALAMGKRIIPIVPRDYDTRALPLSVRKRRYLIQDTPEHTAKQLSKSLLAA